MTSDTVKRLQELSDQMRSVPNIFVTTSRVVAALDQFVKAQEQQFERGAIGSAAIADPRKIYGITIEGYETVKECFGRMMQPRDGERLQLVLSEPIPVELLGHPWTVRQAAEFERRYGLYLPGEIR